MVLFFCEKTKDENLKNGEHLVYFDSIDDMFDKISFYKKNKKLSRDIAENGYDYIKSNLRLIDSVNEMLVEIKKVSK